MGNNPLTEAINQNNYEKVREIVLSAQSEFKLKKLLNSKRSEDGTALHVAVYNKKYRIVIFLLEKGANVNSKSSEVDVNLGLFKIDQTLGYAKCTPLHIAVWKKDLRMMEILVNFGADPRIKNRRGKSPLDCAKKQAIKNHLEKLVRKHVKKSREEKYTNKETEWDEFKKKLRFVKNVNRGSFGLVQVLELEIGLFRHLVAVKKIVPNVDTWNRDFRIFKNEVEHMKNLQHKYVAKLYGCYKNLTELNIVMEYCEKGDLYMYKKLLKTNEERIKCLFQIAEGMAYIHSKSVVHRDLKTKNVLIGDDGNMKITDFGLSVIGEKDVGHKLTASGTLGYAAPEQLNPKPKGTANPFLVDMYAFGIIIWEIYSCKTPYYDIPGDQLRKILRGSRVRPAIRDCASNNLPDPVKELMRRCWKTNPEERPQNFSIVAEELKLMSVVIKNDEED